MGASPGPSSCDVSDGKASVLARAGTLDVDLQTAVGRVLKDEVVSMTEPTLLVRDVERLCRAGDELRPPERSTRLQER
jgi:hypothetical protein